MPASASFFGRYRRQILIETGTWHGDGVQAALDAGFEHVHSIELSPSLYRQARQRFMSDARVDIYLGLSTGWLPMILDHVHTPVTFWLDAHYSAGDTARGPEMTPLLGELDIIAEHEIKEHTILIDDVRLFGTDFADVQLADVEQALTRINPAYRIQHDGDILVAQV